MTEEILQELRAEGMFPERYWLEHEPILSFDGPAWEPPEIDSCQRLADLIPVSVDEDRVWKCHHCGSLMHAGYGCSICLATICKKCVLAERHRHRSDDGMTLEEIGRDFEVSRERIRQIQERGERHLRGRMRDPRVDEDDPKFRPTMNEPPSNLAIQRLIENHEQWLAKKAIDHAADLEEQARKKARLQREAQLRREEERKYREQREQQERELQAKFEKERNEWLKDVERREAKLQAEAQKGIPWYKRRLILPEKRKG